MARAIERFVPDGTAVAMGTSLEHAIPFAAAIVPLVALFFILSQERRSVGTVLSQSLLKGVTS